jgi:ubiquitin-like 1-activating enzyme E1 B
MSKNNMNVRNEKNENDEKRFISFSSYLTFPSLATFHGSFFSTIRSSSVLVVGAGGIGCELLKNLVLSGFRNITIIDLDTIDLSNLNRQFLFRKEHIGKPKSEIARESALLFNPQCNIISYHDNIMNEKYGPSFISQFTLVINALDNIAARRHVNRVCLAADVPLIESGTGGYLGQVQTISKGKTECYECKPKPTPKGYAACTINNTPSRPIHCIVWAKWKYLDYFSVAESNPEAEGDREKNSDEDGNNNNNNNNNTNGTLLEDEEMQRVEIELENYKEKGFAFWLFHKLFYRDIFTQLRIAHLTGKDIWKGRPWPQPLSLSSYLQEEKDFSSHNFNESVLWSLEENIYIFLRSVSSLHCRPPTPFEKDDNICMDFVTSASNLRAHVYGIEMLSRFEAKAQAGNIIPAIATTNAVIAGLIVLEAFKVLQNRISDCQNVFLCKKPSAKRMLIPSPLDEPNPNCFVCSSNTVTLRVNIENYKVESFVADILKSHLTMIEPLVYLGNTLLFDSSSEMDEEEKDHFTQQAQKTFHQLSIQNNTILRAEDNIQQLSVDVIIEHITSFPPPQEGEEEKTFDLVLSGELRQHAMQDVGMVDETKGDDEVEIITSQSQKEQNGAKENAEKRRKLS